MKIEMFAIRNKHTGHYLPKPQGRNGRGGSHMEPVDFKNGATRKAGVLPRLWATETMAKVALTHWLKGKVTCYRASGGYPDYDYDEVNEYIPTPHRHREDMEIVPITVDLP